VETISEPFTIYDWNQMETKMRYTAISRATSLDLISALDVSDTVCNDIDETD
jgi:hypothetical protein